MSYSDRNVIEIDGVSKYYRLGKIGAASLGEDLRSLFVRKATDEKAMTNDRLKMKSDGRVKVLDDISFNISRGEVVGLIGRNGAGKSTLLKILSRITAPSKGEIRIAGRMSSLLEVGTGFHPELSGRENIFLNGAIMGLTRKQIASRLDEIIAFSGMGGYIDTPVKRYSSGMYVRLAFAVAAHLDPEILVVDEVLAVGDADFQKKALGKMKDVSGSEGRTVIFVSHSMSAVNSLCSRGVLLESGRVKMDGEVRKVVDYYLNGNLKESEFGTVPADYPRNVHHRNFARITSVVLRNSEGAVAETIKRHEVIQIEIDLDVYQNLPAAIAGIMIGHELEENLLYVSSSEFTDSDFLNLKEGNARLSVTIHQQLQPGSYFVNVVLWDKEGYAYDYIRKFGRFYVESFGDNDRVYRWKNNIGSVNPVSDFKIISN
jgi:lipopolysaccharide transport system ATP-binding protein